MPLKGPLSAMSEVMPVPVWRKSPVFCSTFMNSRSSERATLTEAPVAMSTLPEPKTPLPASSRMPAVTVVWPTLLLRPVSVSLPVPTFVRRRLAIPALATELSTNEPPKVALLTSPTVSVLLVVSEELVAKPAPPMAFKVWSKPLRS